MFFFFFSKEKYKTDFGYEEPANPHLSKAGRTQVNFLVGNFVHDS